MQYAVPGSGSSANAYTDVWKDNKLKKVYFCHLSGNNNTPDLLKSTMEEYLEWEGPCRIMAKGELWSSTESFSNSL